MKKLRKNQLGPWCSFCPPKTTRAVYRENGFADQFCCSECVSKLKEHEGKLQQAEERITEADEQTWRSL